MSDNTGHPVNIVNPERRNQLYGFDEVYGLGNKPSNQHVVNVNDIIINAPKNELYWVVSVTPTGIPTIQALDFKGVDGVVYEDVVLGTGPGLASEGYRIYVNTSVIPHRAFIDSRVVIAGSENQYLKLFKGYDISPNGEVVSAVFNSANRFVSENIPLEKVTIPHYGDHGYKVASNASVTQTLLDGEVLTAVVYTNSGEVTSRFSLLVVNTEFVRDLDASSKKITDITLLTPYMSESDSEVIEIPLGMVAQSSSFIGRVTYSDGSKSSTPVDGQRFALFGYDTFVASNVGEIVPVVLSYNLSSAESSNFVKTQGDRRFITKDYKIRTVESESRYKVKIFITPYWDNADLCWKLDYWLYSLDRDICIKVTDLVEVTGISGGFDGTNFGVPQALTVALELDRLGPSYLYERHVDTFSITLLHGVNNQRKSAYYSLNYGSNNIVGVNALAYVSGMAGDYTLDISNAVDNVDILLTHWYYNSSPLIYTFNEENAPAPTHVRIVIGSWSREIVIEDILKPITDVSAVLDKGVGVNLEFIKITNLKRLELGKMGLTAVMS